MANDTTTTAAQMSFVKELENQVATFLGNRLDGTFQCISNPSGFHYQLTAGPDDNYNAAALDDLDMLVKSGDGGMMIADSGESFSGLYLKILGDTGYQLSKADQATMQNALGQAEAQQGSMITSFQANFGPITDDAIKASSCFPATKVGYIMSIVQSKWKGNIANCPIQTFRVAYQQWQDLAAPAVALSAQLTQGIARVGQAISNTTTPSAANGGFQTGASSFAVGYADLPATTVIVSSLGPSNAGNAVTIGASLSHESSTSSSFSVEGSTGFSVPLDFVTIGVSASAKYTLDKLNSFGQALSISLTYPSITIVGSKPTNLSKDGSQGWYDSSIIDGLVENTGVDTSGYALNGSAFSVGETFGQGKRFARARTLVLSQLPTVTMVFHKATLSVVQSNFKQGASVSLKLWDFIQLGSVGQSYSVSSVTQDDKSGDVTMTLAPPAISGTVPPEQQTCNVLGGVIEYPA